MGTSFKDLSPSPEDIVYSLKDIIRKIRMNEISTIEVDDIMSPIDNILMHNKASMCHKSPCGAGKDMLTVFPSGKIYACDCLVHPDFELGNIKDSSFMESRKSEKLIVLDNRTVEQNLALLHLLGEADLWGLDDLQSFLESWDSEYCRFIRMLREPEYY